MVDFEGIKRNQRWSRSVIHTQEVPEELTDHFNVCLKICEHLDKYGAKWPWSHDTTPDIVTVSLLQ